MSQPSITTGASAQERTDAVHRDLTPPCPARAPVIPSIGYAPEILVLMIVSAIFVRTTDPDLWGHIRFGQAMIASRHLVLRDPYSYSAFGHLWLNHEWLSEVIMALVYDTLGVIGLKIWKLGCAAAVGVFIILGMAQTAAPPRLQFRTLAAALIAMAPLVQLRPQLFTFVLFAAMIALLARHQYRGSAPLWLLVPIMALWVNLHGGFFIGIVTLWVYAAVLGLSDLIESRPLGHTLLFVPVAIASTLATFLTPYGKNAWIVVIDALKNPVTRKIIDDWKPPTAFLLIHGHIDYVFALFVLCAFGLMAALVISIVLPRSVSSPPLVAIAGIMSLGAVIAVRNLPLAAIACATPLSGQLALLQCGKRAKPPSVQTSSPFSTSTRWAMAVVAVIAITAQTGFLSDKLPTDAPYPSGAVSFMKQHGLHGNVLSQFNWGEYLIWHMAPSSKVFMDGRYDTVYPFKVIEDYLTFHADAPSADKVLRSYPHAFVLVSPDLKPYAMMLKSPGWKLIYHDKVSALFARADSAAVKLPGVPVAGRVPSVQYFP